MTHFSVYLSPSEKFSDSYIPIVVVGFDFFRPVSLGTLALLQTTAKMTRCFFLCQYRTFIEESPPEHLVKAVKFINFLCGVSVEVFRQVFAWRLNGFNEVVSGNFFFG